MSIYSNVTEEDLINLRKLATQQKEQRALQIRNKFLKQSHDKKLAESLSPITKRLDDVEESTEKLGDGIKESQPKTPQLAIENTPQPETLQLPIENNQDDTQPSVLYDASLENTSKNMENNTGFFKSKHDPKDSWMLNNHPIKNIRGTEVEIKENIYDITLGIRKVSVDQTYDTAKLMTDKDKLIFRDISQKTDHYNRKPTKGRLTGRDKYIKNDLDNDVLRILNLDTKLKGRGIEKIIFHQI